MLKQRILTAVLLTGALLAALALLPAVWLALVFAVVLLAAAWEWAGLCDWNGALARLLYVLGVGLGLLGVVLYTNALTDPSPTAIRDVLGAAGLWWAVALLWIKTYPASTVVWRHRATRAAMGLLTLVPAWTALVYLRQVPDGLWLIIFVFALVAAADIGGYFVGRTWGRSKLAPRVSPGKSWNGLWGGLGTALVLALVVWVTLLRGRVDALAMIVIVGLTVPASVLGDLLESMLKRHRGVKDSGALLPGHGGLLDRIDSITAAAPVFALLWLLLAV